MKICVYGAGAVGGVIAARLALSGASVSVVARGEHLNAIRETGLRLETSDSIDVVRVTASDEPGALGRQDVVIAAVKAHQLPDIVGGLTTLLNEGTAVIYAVNGMPWWYFHNATGPSNERRLPALDPGGRLWDQVGVGRTIGCIINFPAAVISPGSVRQGGGNNRIALGELGGEQSLRLADIAAALRSAGFVVDTHRPIREEVWTKLAHVMVASTIAVLTSAPPGIAFSDAAIRDLARKIYGEAFDIAAAHGYPGSGNIDALIAGQQRSTNKPSMLQDLEAGRPMEIDPQLTVPIALAHDARVRVPILDVLLGLIRARASHAGLYKGAEFSG